MKAKFKKILVVQTLFLGDLILTIPLIQRLSKEYPEALIDVLVQKGNEVLLRNNPSIDKILIYDKTSNDKGITGIFGVAKRLRQEHYNLAFVLSGSMRSAIAVYLAGIPRRIGTDQSTGIDLFIDKVKFPREAWKVSGGKIIKLLDSMWKSFGKKYSFVSSLYTDIVQIDPKRHAIERNLQLLKPLGIEFDSKDRQVNIYPNKRDITTINDFLESWSDKEQKIVAVAPGSQWKTKRWLTENYIEVIIRLINDDVKIVLIGGKSDIEICQKICSAVDSKLIKNACNKFTILESAVLIGKCNLFLTNDSAAMHIGAAVDIPCVIIMGPTIQGFGFVPIGHQHKIISVDNLWCRPCTPFGGETCPTGTLDCMKQITIDRVHTELLKTLKQLYCVTERYLCLTLFFLHSW